MENDPLLVAATADLAVKWAQTFDELLVAVPDGRDGNVVLSAMGQILSLPRPDAPGAASRDADLRGRCDREAIARDPTAVAPRVREAQARLEALSHPPPSPLCGDHARCREEILEQADAIAAAEPDSVIAVQLRARVLLVDGEVEEAVKMLEKDCDHVTERVACLQLRVEAATRLKAPAPLASAAKDL